MPCNCSTPTMWRESSRRCAKHRARRVSEGIPADASGSEGFIMPTVWIPAPLRSLTEQQETVQVAGATVGEVIEQLESRFPGIKARLCDGGSLRRGLVVAIDSEVSRAGLEQAVGE